MDGGLIVFKGGGAGWMRRTTRSHNVILAAPVSSFPPKAGLTNKWSEAGIQLKYASGVAGHNRRLRRRNNAASKRLCHATRDDISIAGSPPTGEDDGVGVFVSFAAGRSHPFAVRYTSRATKPIQSDTIKPPWQKNIHTFTSWRANATERFISV